MSATPSNPRAFTTPTHPILKLTPTNASYSRGPRSPNKTRSLFESGLSLRRIIGTTVSSPTGFDSLPTGRIFAYVAGAAAVVVQLEDDLKYTQRFFRAHPSAQPILQNNHSTAPSTPVVPETRNKTVASLRESTGLGYAPSTPTNSRQIWGDSPLSKTWTSRERIKAATCLSISKDGRFLAVGETGYTPRVLIFNIHESTDIPLVILSEHTFGVTAVSFSPDGRYLATLGTPNDGFLFIWAISNNGAARLHASNKCTSIIRGMTWIGNNLITVGTRHVKVWRVEEKPVAVTKQRFASDGTPITPTVVPPTVTKMLPGRNCLLGTLVDSIFTSVAALTEKKAVICTDKGDICTIDDNDGQNHLLKVANAGFAVSAISVDDAKKLIRFGGRCGANKVMALDELLKPSTPPASPCQDEFEGDDLSPNGSICAMAVVNDYVVTADTRHAIKITKKDQPITAAATVPYTAHCDPVMGVRLFSQPNAFSSDFYTYDSSGKVLFWDLEAKCKGSFHVEIEQADLSPDDVLNQCLVVRAATSNSFFATGDKYGILRIIDAKDYTCTFMAKAHLSDIEDIAIFEDSKTTLIATCGRDRTVQLFKKDSDSWTHLQTMDEHTGSVVSVRFCDNGERLLTASSDRTVVIRQVVTREVEGDQVTAAIPIRVLTVKGTPVSLALATNDLTGAFSVVVSMMDRNIATFDVETGKLQRVFKAADGEGNDSVVMSSIVMGKSVGGRPTVLAGVSGTDKSVRIYDGRSGIFLDRGFGHTASVTDIALLESPEQTVLISTGSDSTIMIWDLTAKTPEVVIQPDMPLTNDESTPSKEATTATMPPLRRILSKAELAEFQRSSPAATPSGRNSPPRLRKKISKHSLNKTESPKLNPAPPMPGHHGSYSDEISSSTLHNRERSERSERETRELRNSPRDRNRSRSPPSSPKSRRNDNRSSVNSNSENRGLGLGSRKSSMIDLRSSRGKPPLPSPGEFSSLNMSTDQMCRSLRSYRKKLDSTDSVRDELTSDLVRELQLTAQAVERRRERDCVVYREREREREQSRQSGSRKISDTLLVGLLDQYSDRLIRVFDEKLRLSMLGGTPEVEEKPKAIDSIIESIEVEMPETKKLPLPRSAPASTPVSRKPSTSGSVIITTTAAPEKEATISPQVLIEPCTPEPRVLVEFPEPEDPTADDKDETFLSAKGPGSRVSSTATTASASTSASTPAVAVPERKSSSNRESIIVPKNEHRNSVRAAAASWGRKSVVLTGKGEGGGLEPQSRPGLRRKSRSTTALP